MIERVLIHQAALAREVHEQHPARAARERARHRGELVAPAVGAAETLLQGARHALGGLAISAQRGEIKLMQRHGIECDQLVALQARDLEFRHGREIERREPRGDGVQAPHGAAVVVLVVADDEPVGQTVQEPGPAADGCDRVRHGTSWFRNRGQSTLAPESLTTFDHFSISARISASN